MAKGFLDDLENAASGSKVVNTTKPQSAYKAKTIQRIPVTYFDAHKELRENGKTSQLFTGYILEAIKEKLERDGAL
ncbi:hypothetical protein C942_02317 [Photobacterium marinum]|uniref:Uncharacterized protein n=1 Tax=Photobacterium marinum TaxID=1056511 RepID=L8JAP6_9GAMM|nr:hypothetical protein [Photobacterium marinum]ELR64624.1 hypothetical protein C942_02317 [Photobacterium marinum]